MKKFKYLLLLLIIVLLISCNNSSPINPKDYLSSDVATWEELFKAYWSGLSDNYIFWDLDDQNGEWDNIYYEYLPKFRSLGNIDYTDMKEGVFLLYDMSTILSDGHFYRKTAVELPPFKVDDGRLKNEYLNCYKSL